MADGTGADGGLYALLTSAHYRTSPLDLRRLMDAPGQRLCAALGEARVQGRCGWWKREDCPPRWRRRCGPVSVVRAAAWSPSRWRRTVVRPTLRGCDPGALAVSP
ncbi:hypothetical protein O0544_00465 [Edwardsiella anguillarum]|nr:hypothetical protein [Edwardsiella anguillarum]